MKHEVPANKHAVDMPWWIPSSTQCPPGNHIFRLTHLHAPPPPNVLHPSELVTNYLRKKYLGYLLYASYQVRNKTKPFIPEFYCEVGNIEIHRQF